MKTLHSIILPDVEAWVWHELFGATGRRLLNGTAHAFLVTRGTPTLPIGDRYRRYWYPWNNLPADALHPACGEIRTRARQPLAGPAWAHSRHCPECAALHPDAQLDFELRAQDPWTLMDPIERRTQPDPISGL